MAITGAWAERQQAQAGALQQGTGWNPIHRVRTGDGRNTAPGGSEPVTDQLTAETFGYCDEDTSSVLYGYGEETGTADRPVLGEEDQRGSTPNDFPPWGPYKPGIPGGVVLRSKDHGAELTYTPRDPMLLPAFAGWDNKLTGDVNNAVTSDPSQYEMVTSMVQRDKVRAGTQMPAGRADDHYAPIASRITGMKIKPFMGDPARHNDMEPREQTFTIRPWWSRNAGTGRVAEMKVNTAYESQPLTRNPPADPYQGPILSGSDSGYTQEDPVYW